MSVVTGNLAALGANVAFQTDVTTLPSINSVGVQISGNFTGVLAFQATIDNVNWFQYFAFPLSSGPVTAVQSTAAAGQFAIPVAGFAQVRVIFSSYVAGTAVVSLDGTNSEIVVNTTPQTFTVGSSLGGPMLASGLPSLSGSDPEREYQAKSSAVMQLIPTISGNNFVTFIDNPWIQGLTVGSQILLSTTPNGIPVESAYVSTVNIPSATVPGAITLTLNNPLVNSNSIYATFDAFSESGPTVFPPPSFGATVIGTKAVVQFLLDPAAFDPKRPLFVAQQAKGNQGVQAVVPVTDALGSNDTSLIRQYLEAMLVELRILNYLILQLKDGGAMDVPNNISSPATWLTGQ